MWKCLYDIINENANIVLFSQQPFTSVLNYSNIKDFRYEVIWQKQQCTYPMCAKKRIMPIHENISIFYKKAGVYNPQMRTGFKPYSSYENKEKKLGEVYSSKVSKHRSSDGDRYPISILQFSNVRKNSVHPTQKPLDLMEYLVKTYSNEGDTILDFTMGSGSTGVACMNTGRNFIGIEKEEKYFKIAKERIKEAERNYNIWEM
jgi:site-specific DNA-methyltransferase (adenine-specific)